MPDVDNCRSDFMFSVDVVLSELNDFRSIGGPEPLEGGECSGGRTLGAALCTGGSDGRVAFERDDKPTMEVGADDLFLRVFLVVAAMVDGGGAGGISSTGESCGERRELISISTLGRQSSAA